MIDATIVGRSAISLAQRIRDRDLSAVDVLTAHLDRTTELDPRINAYAAVRRGPAFEDAKRIDAPREDDDLPLCGVPVAVKDDVNVEGLPTRRGSLGRSAEPKPADGEIVRRLKAAGAIVVGKTREPDLGIWGFTESLGFGATKNPWDLGRSPGGSSGGSAAAVAAGMVPIAVGSDGLGSIRIPAAWCGLFGLKPGAGVVPRAEDEEEAWFGLTDWGPLATTVADAALLLDVLAGRTDLRDPVEPTDPLRIAVSFALPPPGAPLDPEQRDATVQTASALRTAGHEVTAADPDYPKDLVLLALRHWYQGVAEDVDHHQVDERLVEPRTQTMARMGRWWRRVQPVTPSERDELRARLDAWFSHHDLLLTPTTAKAPFRVGELHGRGLTWTVNASMRAQPYPGTWNIVGYPAASVPAGRTRDGLPIGVQLVAPRGREGLLLSVAAQLERLRPWERLAPVTA